MRTEPVDKRVRGYLGSPADGGPLLVDTRDPLLYWEDDFPIPSYALPMSDVRTDLLRPSLAAPEVGWSFHGAHGPVAEWFDLVVGDQVLPHAAWRRDDPALQGRLAISWDPALPLRWTEEDEEVFEHPRDPHHRVEVLPSSRHVVVRREGVVLAESSQPVLLLETGLPTRYYLPRQDVATELLEPSSTTTSCPYKGRADRYMSVTGQDGGQDLVWCYTDPKPAVGLIAGRLAFYDEHVDVTIDGVDVPRPVSPFS